MSHFIAEVRRALEIASRPVVSAVHYQDMDRVSLPGGRHANVVLTPLERRAEATRILRAVHRLPPYEQAVIVGMVGEPALREGAVLVLLDVVQRDTLGDGPAKEAIRWYFGNKKAMSTRKLAREFGGSKSTHDRYRQQVCQELDRWYRRAIAMCRHEDIDQVHLND